MKLRNIRFINLFIVFIFSINISVLQASQNRAVGVISSYDGKTIQKQYGSVNHAIIIGIDKYSNHPNLDTAVNDAKELVNILKDKYFFSRRNIILLTDYQATRKQIIQEFEDLITLRVKEGDNVLIYYAGHGWFDNTFKIGYWVTTEATNDKTTYLQNNTVYQTIAALDRKKVKHIMLISDSCFSGNFIRKHRDIETKINDEYFHEYYSKPSRNILTSGGDEVVSDEGKDGHSIFAYYFLKQLKDNSFPYISFKQLGYEVEKMVTRNSNQKPISKFLHGVGDEDGQFFFINKYSVQKNIEINQPSAIKNSDLKINKNQIKITQEKNTPNNNIYVTHLAFMDPTKGTSIFGSEAGSLINAPVIKGIKIAEKNSSIIKYNKPGHLIDNTDDNVNKLVNITFDPNLTRHEKMAKIINDIMEPNKVDVIVTGNFIEKEESVDVRPLIIVKHQNKIVCKMTEFKKKDFFLTLKSQCKGFKDDITRTVRELLLNEDEYNGDNIFVAYLPLMNSTNGSTLSASEADSLINNSIIKGIKLAQKNSNIIKYGKLGHSIYNTDINFNKLVNIIFDPNLRRKEKISKIIKDIMRPNGVDIIVTGLYREKDDIVVINLLKIVEQDQKIVLKYLTFKKDFLLCINHNHQSPKRLFKSAEKEISKLVTELLKAL